MNYETLLRAVKKDELNSDITEDRHHAGTYERTTSDLSILAVSTSPDWHVNDKGTDK